MADERHNLYLVDGSWIIFRAFHVLPPLTNSRGLPTGATYGFVRMLVKLLKDTRPTHIAVVFDSPKKTFRDDLFESYKANREAAPSDLLAQIPYIHRSVEAFRIKSIMIDGVEPRALVDIMALMGDTIDNVKGVPGIGEKTASALIQHFGGLEGLLAGLDRLEETKIRGAKKFAGLIAEHRADVELARKLVRIETDVPLELRPA